MHEHGRMSAMIHGYLNGELDDGERRELEGHLEACPECQTELAELREVHERLLNYSEAPPPQLKERVLGALPHRRSRRKTSFTAAAAVILVLLVGSVAYLSGLFPQQEVASAALQPASGDSGMGGEVYLYDAGSNVRVDLELWGMPDPNPGEYYELWFRKDGEVMSGGTFLVGPDGRLQATTTAPAMVKDFPRVGVTMEKAEDSPSPEGPRMLGGELRDAS